MQNIVAPDQAILGLGKMALSSDSEAASQAPSSSAFCHVMLTHADSNNHNQKPIARAVHQVINTQGAQEANTVEVNSNDSDNESGDGVQQAQRWIAMIESAHAAELAVRPHIHAAEHAGVHPSLDEALLHDSAGQVVNTQESEFDTQFTKDRLAETTLLVDSELAQPVKAMNDEILSASVDHASGNTSVMNQFSVDSTKRVSSAISAEVTLPVIPKAGELLNATATLSTAGNSKLDIMKTDITSAQASDTNSRVLTTGLSNQGVLTASTALVAESAIEQLSDADNTDVNNAGKGVKTDSLTEQPKRVLTEPQQPKPTGLGVNSQALANSTITSPLNEQQLNEQAIAPARAVADAVNPVNSVSTKPNSVPVQVTSQSQIDVQNSSLQAEKALLVDPSASRQAGNQGIEGQANVVELDPELHSKGESKGERKLAASGIEMKANRSTDVASSTTAAINSKAESVPPASLIEPDIDAALSVGADAETRFMPNQGEAIALNSDGQVSLSPNEKGRRGEASTDSMPLAEAIRHGENKKQGDPILQQAHMSGGVVSSAQPSTSRVDFSANKNEILSTANAETTTVTTDADAEANTDANTDHSAQHGGSASSDAKLAGGDARQAAQALFSPKMGSVIDDSEFKPFGELRSVNATATAEATQLANLRDNQPEKLQQQLNKLTKDALDFSKHDFVNKMRERMLLMVAGNVHTAEIKLDPAELGAINVRVQVQGEQASIAFSVQQQQTKDALESSMPRLREMLQEQGIKLGDSQVQQQNQQQSADSHQGSAQTPDELIADESELDLENHVKVVDLSPGRVDFYA